MPNFKYGVEIEKPFVDLCNGDTFGVGNSYFENLNRIKTERGEEASIATIGQRSVGVKTELGEEGLDCGFNIGESATGPISEDQGGLRKLDEIINTGLSDVISSLAEENAGVLNMSNHPLTTISDSTYSRFVVPKPAYGFAREVRGWNHKASINACAQNSPSTSVSAFEAADAVNVMIGLGASMIALYANSPFKEGRVTDMQESRMNVWQDFFQPAKVPGDRELHMAPPEPIKNLRDYFNWMFGDGTNIFVVMQDVDQDIKKSLITTTVDGNPSVMDYLSQESWPGKIYGSEKHVYVRPSLGHMAMNQFMQFNGARIRYGFINPEENPNEFVSAMKGAATEVEDVMSRLGDYFYIEGRDPGANFADRELEELDPMAARSVLISATALQSGLIRNLPESKALVESYRWETLMELREKSAKLGLDAESDGLKASTLCKKVLEIASRGLSKNETWMLSYPEFVIRTGLNGAVRARKAYEKSNKVSEAERIREVVMQRTAVSHDKI